ncbi:MAG: DGQHR domain-containing protein [Bacteroidales bacterium]|nr:DGQHR domain-containing protein [Bacteroidales bacterium]
MSKNFTPDSTAENHINLFVQQCNRGSQTAVLCGCIPFGQLLPKLNFHERSSDAENKGGEESSYYQRQIEAPRLAKIRKHIRSCFINDSPKAVSPSPLFPTSIIIAFDLPEDEDNFDLDSITPGELVNLNHLPKGIMIVDGQHRLRAMKTLMDEPSTFSDKALTAYIMNFQFNCTVLVNYDMWEQAQVFATVNFNQKSVTKSLFYDIYGIEPPSGDNESIPKQNEIYVAHQLTNFLNTFSKSPLKGRIKMLGKGKGHISQAAVVEALLKLLKPSGALSDVVPALKGGKKSLLSSSARELVTYFSAIKDTFEQYWPNEDDRKVSVMLKTTGISALLKFFEVLHGNMPPKLREEIKSNYNDPDTVNRLKQYFLKQFAPIKPHGEELFSIEKGEFNGSGGGGLQKKLYDSIYSYWR